MDKLTPQRRQFAEEILKNLESGVGLWKPGWRVQESPESITGKKYRGVNNLFLTIVAMERGYTDNRWMTFHQMTERDWRFKTDEEGRSLGKGAGVTVEYYELRDHKTKKPFDRQALTGMDADEREEYMRENVKPLRRFYRVFNGDLIDGIPQLAKTVPDPNTLSPRAESLLEYWNENESKIIYGGHSAFYSITTDEIHLPERDEFYGMPEFYATALHEIGHSTGHGKRLNRDLAHKFGTPGYAMEELRAEFASLFMEQDLGISVEAGSMRNNAAYIKNWHESIKENPNVLFTAIADADRIAKFVTSKKKAKATEPYAVVTEENEYGDRVYRVYMTAAHGQTALAIDYAFTDRDALMKEFEKMQGLPHWSDREFREVSMDELEKLSAQRAAETEVQEEKSEVYMPPSEIVARATKEYRTVDMTGRGVERISRMDDRETVERAFKGRLGDKLQALYNGGTLFNDEERDEEFLMLGIATYCHGDTRQAIRIFRESGQWRDEKPDVHYEKMADKAVTFVENMRRRGKETNAMPARGRALSGVNAKT